MDCGHGPGSLFRHQFILLKSLPIHHVLVALSGFNCLKLQVLTSNRTLEAVGSIPISSTKLKGFSEPCDPENRPGELEIDQEFPGPLFFLEA